MMTETDLLRIREHVVDMARHDALLARLPEGAREQVGMVLHEVAADLSIAEQKGA